MDSQAPQQQHQPQQQAAPNGSEYGVGQAPPMPQQPPVGMYGNPMYASHPGGDFGGAGYAPAPFGMAMMYQQQAPMVMFPGHAPMVQHQRPPVAHPENASSATPSQDQGANSQSQQAPQAQSSEGAARSAPEGDKSWAQIARDPDQAEDEETAQKEAGTQEVQHQSQNQNQGHGQQGQGSSRAVVNNADHRNWSQQVKDSAKQFTYAQHIFAAAQQSNPFVYLSMAMQVPQEIHNMMMQGLPLPPDFEPYELAARHLRTICSLNFLMFVNLEPQQLPRTREYFVVQCENEMEVFQYIKRSTWTISSEAAAGELEAAYGQVSGVGLVLLLFIIPSLRKLVGVAEVASNVIKMEGSDESCVQLRWIFIRDIPIYHLKQVDFLNNPNFRRSQQQHARDSAAETAGEGAESATEQNAEKETSTTEESVTKVAEGEGESETSAGKAETTDATETMNGTEAPAEASESKENRKAFFGPSFYSVPTTAGNFAYDVIARFKLNGGILLDFGEYALAEQQGRAPLPENLTCGGPRQRPVMSSSRGGRGGRGMSRFNSRGGRGGRGGNSNHGGSRGGNFSNAGGASEQRQRGGRGRGRGGRGGMYGDNEAVGNTRDGERRQGRGRGRGGRPQTRKVEGSDGQQMLRSQYTYEIQHKKGGKPRGKAGSTSEETAAAPTQDAE